MKECMIDDSDELDLDEAIDEDESTAHEFIIKDGKLSLKPDTIEMTVEDFKVLQKGLELLRTKYPKISKECFT